MPPRFSLQSILDYHHNRVEILEVELGTLVHTRHEIMDMLMFLMKEQERMLEELRDLQSGELDLQTISLIRYNIHGLQENIERQQQALSMLEKAIETKQMEIVQARQDEAVFDKLKEKELVRFQVRMDQQEKIMMDDIYVSKARRQSTEFSEEQKR
jgi:flagellar export protein FliJ